MKAHAIMISLPPQGHLNPFVDLAMKLASKGITVTFVLTQHAHLRVAKSLHIPASAAAEVDIFSGARASGLDIHYTTISDGFPLDFDRGLNVVEYWESLIRDFPSLVDKFVGDLIASSDPSLPPFLVADTLASWPAVVCRNHNLLNVSFFTQPASVFAVDYYRHLLVQNGHYPPKDDDDDDEHAIDYIPGIENISTKDLSSHLQEADTTIIHDIVFQAFRNVVKADFILHNTLQELEAQTLSLLNQEQPTYAIGPIKFSTKTSIPKSLLHEVDCSEWLASRPPNSVLYVSFGSTVQISREVMEEIAQGILLSEVNFVWVDRDIALPVGFENEVKDRGLIVRWCNQLAVLSSPAVGGFLTHCGWNSTLESIWCGVPMICHPVMYDQPTNRKLVVDDWKIGINLCDGGLVNRKEVAEKINELMSGASFDFIRKNMKEERSKMRNAWNKNGSSEINFDHFLKDLNDKILAEEKIRTATSDSFSILRCPVTSDSFPIKETIIS